MDLARMDAMTEEDIERTSPPELRNLPPDFWDRAVLVPPVVVKKAISLRVDAHVLQWFQDQGPGYQTRMNAVLRTFMERSIQRDGASRPRDTPSARSKPPGRGH
jgi:uncharacterized protein (DUF4415 family)